MAQSRRSFFSNRFVQIIMTMQVLAQIGIWVRNYAVLLYVMDQTNGDPFAVSMISVAEFAPIFLFSFIGGTFADRWRPKLTMIWCELLSAVSVFTVLLTMMYGSWKAVFFATLVSAILSQFSQPSGMKLFKVHVPGEQMQMGMAMFQTVMALFLIIGPAIGGFVYNSYGIYVSMVITGTAFVLSAAVLMFLPPDPREEMEQPKQTTILQEMKEGVAYVMGRQVLKILSLCFMLAGIGVGLVQPLLVFLVTEQLGMPKEDIQWMMMATGAAMLVGGGLAMGLAKKVSPQKLLAVGMLFGSLTAGAIGYTTNWYVALLLQFLNGLFLPFIHIGINTLLLQVTEESFIGRVNGILSPLFMGMMVLAMSVSGVLKKSLSLPPLYLATGVLFFVGMLTLLPLFKMDFSPKPADNGESAV
jgi:DHA3 family macrolide efflux protein-like MFS transporter